MAIEVFEKLGSREVDASLRNSSIPFEYALLGSDDEAALQDALRATASPTYSYGGVTYVLTGAKLRQISHGVWEGTVTYGHPEDGKSSSHPETNSVVTTFDTSGGTFHITEAISQTGYAKQNKVAPAIANTINVQDNKTLGVDIIIPQLTFRETHYLPLNIVTPSYIKSLAATTGKTNEKAFRSFAIGELLFAGANGSLRTSGDWEIFFDFVAEENITQPFQIGEITVPSKKGHEYLWVLYNKVEENNDKLIVPEPLAVFVAQVYEEADFAAILKI